MKRWMTFGLTIALSALLSVSFADGEHEDIHLGAMDGAAAVIEPEELAEPPYRLRYTLTELLPGLFGADVGWDFHTEEDDDHPHGCSVSMSAGASTPKRATTTRNCAK